jgi:hypothetical protein
MVQISIHGRDMEETMRPSAMGWIAASVDGIKADGTAVRPRTRLEK